jgi:hypothetical protein
MAVNINVKFIDPEWMLTNFGPDDAYTNFIDYIQDLPVSSRYSYLDSTPSVDTVRGSLGSPDSIVYAVYYAENTESDFGTVNYIINYDTDYLIFQDFSPSGDTIEVDSYFFWGFFVGVALNPTAHTCFNVVIVSDSITYDVSSCIEITGGGWRIGFISMR